MRAIVFLFSLRLQATKSYSQLCASTLLDLYETSSHSQKCSSHYLRCKSHEIRTEAGGRAGDLQGRLFAVVVIVSFVIVIVKNKTYSNGQLVSKKQLHKPLLSSLLGSTSAAQVLNTHVREM